MRALSRFSHGLARLLTLLGGLGALMAMAMITVDVTLRMFGGSLPGTYEIVVNYLMLTIAFLPLARVERLDQMIAVEAFVAILGRRAQHAIGLFVAFFAIVVYGAITYATWLEAVKRFGTGAYQIAMTMVIATWPAYFVIPLGFAAATAVVLVRTLELVLDQRAHEATATDAETGQGGGW